MGHLVFTHVQDSDRLLIEYERRVADAVVLRGHGICHRGSGPGELVLRWWDPDRAQATVFVGQEVDGRVILSATIRSRLRWSLARVTNDLLTVAIAESIDGIDWVVHRLSAYRRWAPSTA